MLAAQHVRDPLDRGVGQRLAEEVDLGRARDLRDARDTENGAVVLLQDT